jgi:hypothetical protein
VKTSPLRAVPACAGNKKAAGTTVLRPVRAASLPDRSGGTGPVFTVIGGTGIHVEACFASTGRKLSPMMSRRKWIFCGAQEMSG